MYQGNDMPLGQRLVRGWNGPLPFYMSRPGYLGAKEEEKMLADLEYLQQMYPAKVRRLSKRIAQMLDRMDYEGSMIYDEYPDSTSLRAIANSCWKVLEKEEELPPEENLVQVLLFSEIYKRRHGGRRGIIDIAR